jgi:hypothetical protein
MGNKLGLVFCFLCSNLFGNQGDRQYTLIGLDDGRKYAVTVSDKYAEDLATFSIKGDSLTILGVRGIDTLSIHSGKFFEVKFRVRGGSGVRLREVVLLSISGQRIHRNLHIQSDVSSRMDRAYDRVADSLKLFDEKSDYHVTIGIKEFDSRYQLLLAESKVVTSKYNPSQNESFQKSYELTYDVGGHFFYYNLVQFDRSFEISTPNDDTTTTRFVNGQLPAIQLHGWFYMLVDNKWCTKSANGDALFCR